ncbi:hypothetical protein [Oleidesulfovibrio sp.]|uniref:hypothetical protein n=1 Tax=Oleidesulfovibrio sp. TaxID=2909707 RepID=UPI003A84B7A8
MKDVHSRIMAVTDNLGMERPVELGDVPMQVTWPFLLQKHLSKTHNDVEVMSLSARARTMDSLPDAIVDAAKTKADIIFAQIGIVDCFPRITSREDKEHIGKVSPKLQNLLWQYIKSNRVQIVDEIGCVVYTELETYRR